MTDVAIPYPEPVDGDAVQEGQILRPSQLRRAEALRQARDVLASKALFGSNVTGFTVGDLIVLAGWIIANPDDVPKTDDEADAALEAVKAAGEEAWNKYQSQLDEVRAPTWNPPDQSALDSENAEVNSELRAVRSDADDGV